jgi:acetoin utilization deacetylase AcuC-like enzyme
MFPILYSEEFLDHKTGSFHPERPERLTAIVQALHAVPWHEKLDWRQPTPAGERSVLDWIEKVHPPEYVKLVRRLSQRGGGRLDTDTPVSSRTYDVALLAVSAWLDGVDCVIENGEPAFVLARPPGHHATCDRGMGFCIFSNAAIAAHYALEQPGIDRVAILDWDVHHGNGTQAIVETNPKIAYCSLHESPHYPGTGDASERGSYDNVLNLPMRGGSSIVEYQPMFDRQAMPFLENFQPDLLIVSAGYDANAIDPLSSVLLKPQDYSSFAHSCLQLTRRVLFGLEGGYDLQALAESVVATIEACF